MGLRSAGRGAAGGSPGRWWRSFISHRRGIYYALLTIAFGQIFWFVAIKWHSVTRGEDGLLNIKRGRPSAFARRLESLYYFCFAVFVHRGAVPLAPGRTRRSAAC